MNHLLLEIFNVYIVFSLALVALLSSLSVLKLVNV